MKKKLVFVVLIGLIFGYYVYDQVFLPSDSEDMKEVELLIPSGSNLESVAELLEEKDIIRNKWLFKFVAKRKNYQNRISPGKYKLPEKISLNNLINTLRIGSKNVVNFTFNNIYTLNDLAGKAGATFDADSVSFLTILEDKETRDYYGFSPQNYSVMFIPNTYEFNSDTTPEQFVKRMAKEFKAFWNDDRTVKLNALNLTYSEVVTLASIVQAEQQAVPSEWKRIAGLYLNRVRKGMALQSDPTIKFAVGNWKIKRVLNKHLEVDSPYNTYRYPGIPPGPILFPDIKAVDAVLNSENHSYFYMCAKADFSGKHEFSKNLSMHNKYAAAYRKALNKRRIYN